MKNRLTTRTSLLLLVLLVSEGAGALEETESQDQDAQMPDLELLEFLGSFETDEGDWISPNDLVEIEFELLLTTAQENPQDDENLNGTLNGTLNAKPGSN